MGAQGCFVFPPLVPIENLTAIEEWISSRRNLFLTSCKELELVRSFSSWTAISRRVPRLPEKTGESGVPDGLRFNRELEELLSEINRRDKRMLQGRVIVRLTVLVVLAVVFCGSVQPMVGQNNFSIAATPVTSTVSVGATATYTVTVTSTVASFTTPVNLTVACPGGASTTCHFGALQVTPSPAGTQSALTIIPDNSTPVSSSVVITGATGGAGPETHTATVTLNVQAAGTTTPQDISSTLKNNLGFGVGLGLSTNVTGPNIVNSATIDANGIVRVNTRANTTAGLILETHYYIWPWPKCVDLPLKPECGGVQQADNRRWGTGPFVAVQPGSSQIIAAAGGGWMIGFRREKGAMPNGFGLGVGYEAIPAAQVLGSEFVDGKPAPVGPNGQPLPIRYTTEDKGALLFVLSVTF
jgi:hypothetical protein